MTSGSRRVVVAMSGGVDSSVAAVLLLRDGWEAIGVTLNMQRCEESPATGRPCCGLDGASRAGTVAGMLGMPHYVLDCRKEFEESVLRPCWNEYARGRTPNPCVLCNQHVKFGVLLDFAVRLNASRIATGHYARMEFDRGGVPTLLRGVDRQKDQSYFLFTLGRRGFEFAIFPLGGLRKTDVREMAHRFGLPNSGSPESQDACFSEGEGTFAEMLRLRFHQPARPGLFRTSDGRTLGRHGGVHNFTVGQRRGLGLALGKRGWVQAVDAESGEVTVCTEEEELLSDGLTASHVTWHGAAPPGGAFPCTVQVRYRHPPVPAVVGPNGPGSALVRFEKPVKAVTPGQAAVFYSDDRQIGGGWIERAL